MPLAEHLGSHLAELRRRLMISLAAVLVFSGLAYAFAEPIAEFVMAPLFAASPSLKSLVYTNLTEAFFAYLKLSLCVGLAASLPVVMYQVWGFVAPGLQPHEKRLIRVVALLGSGLFVLGAAFAYFAILPRMLHFLMSFAGQNLEPRPRFEDYLIFMARAALAFGLAFEIPFLMAAVVKTGLLPAGHFRRKRPYFYLVLAVLAFLLAAGEPFSALLLILPLGVLYEIGNLIAQAVGGGLS